MIRWTGLLHLEGKACLLIRRHDHFTPARPMRRDVKALTARNHPAGRYYSMKRHALEREFIDYTTSMITDEDTLRGFLFY